MEPPRVPFSAEGGSLGPGDSRGVQAHGTRAPKSWGFLHLFQPPHFLGGSGKFPESSEEQCLLLGPGPVISCRAAERLLGFGGLVPSGLQARALGNPPPLAPQSCYPGLLFGLQVGLLARPLGPPWRAPPVPAARARVNRALSVWAGAGRELGTASPRNAHCGSGCLFQLNDRSEAPGPINSVFWAGGGLGDRGTQTDNQVSQGDKLSPPRRAAEVLVWCVPGHLFAPQVLAPLRQPWCDPALLPLLCPHQHTQPAGSPRVSAPTCPVNADFPSALTG